MAARDQELIELRREIHRRPELAGEERQTAGLVAEQLRAAGLEVTTGVGGHGVVAVLDGSPDGPTVAYRADMDARASWPFNCEDFALFRNEVPGAQFYLGVADTETGMNGARHTPRTSPPTSGPSAMAYAPWPAC